MIVKEKDYKSQTQIVKERERTKVRNLNSERANERKRGREKNE